MHCEIQIEIQILSPDLINSKILESINQRKMQKITCGQKDMFVELALPECRNTPSMIVHHCKLNVRAMVHFYK